MTSFATISASVLAVATVVMVGLIALIRIASGLRVRVDAETRPWFEIELASLLAGEDVSQPERFPSRRRRDVVRTVLVDVAIELRGVERERVTEAFEASGVVDDALGDLGSRRPHRRRRAADTLAAARVMRTVPALELALDDSDSPTRLMCVRALADIGPAELAPRLLDAVRQGMSHAPGGTVVAAVLALGQHRPEVLGAALEEGSLPLQRLVIKVIGELRLQQHSQALCDMLDSADLKTVSLTARALGQIGEANAVDRLQRLVAAPTTAWQVAAAAVTSLGQIGDPHAVATLQGALNATNYMVRCAAAEALGLLGPVGKAALQQAIFGDEPLTRALATRELMR